MAVCGTPVAEDSSIGREISSNDPGGVFTCWSWGCRKKLSMTGYFDGGCGF